MNVTVKVNERGWQEFKLEPSSALTCPSCGFKHMAIVHGSFQFPTIAYCPAEGKYFKDKEFSNGFQVDKKSVKKEQEKNNV